MEASNPRGTIPLNLPKHPDLYLSGDTNLPPRYRVLSRRRFINLKKRLAACARDLNEVWHINSGYRSIAEQRRLYNLYLAGKGNLAAKPGRSAHNYGGAADVSAGGSNVGSTDRRRKKLKEYGLCLPVRGEPWHVQIGTLFRA